MSLVPLFAGLTREQQADGRPSPARSPWGPARPSSGLARGRRLGSWCIRGWVRLSRTTADGKSTTLQILGPGEVAGETWLLTGERPENDVVALETVRM